MASVDKIKIARALAVFQSYLLENGDLALSIAFAKLHLEIIEALDTGE